MGAGHHHGRIGPPDEEALKRLRGYEAREREAAIPSARWDAEVERSLEIGLPGSDSIEDPTISTFSRTELPHFAGINTFMHFPYLEDVRGVGDYDVAVLGAPFDMGTTYRSGPRFGPQAIRRISGLYSTYNYEFGVDLREQLRACDLGDIFVIPGNIACFAGAVGTLIIGVPFAIVALSANDILAAVGSTADGPVLYALLQDAAPAALAALVLSGIVAASFSTADGAILGTAAVLARNVFGIREENEGTGDRLLIVTRAMTVPVTLIGIFFAIRVPQTGILIILAFDVLFAGLLVPFILGLWWGRPTGAVALAGIVAGTATRLAFFALLPTTYGAQNTLVYVENGLFGPAFDGVPTLISPLVGLAVFIAVALAPKPATAPSVPADLDPRGPRIVPSPSVMTYSEAASNPPPRTDA